MEGRREAIIGEQNNLSKGTEMEMKIVMFMGMWEIGFIRIESLLGELVT